MRELLAAVVLVSSLAYVPVVLAAGPSVVPSAPAQVPAQLPAPPPVPAPLGPGLGTPNPFATLANPGSTRFQSGVANPQNNPYPMLPWGDGQIGGVRYGQVVRYWEQNPETVYGVVLVPIPQEEIKPEEVKPEGEPQSEPGAPVQGALEVGKRAAPQDVTVPASLIVETTRGYLHMPRWVLQDVGGGRHQWAWVGAWFQPK